MRASNLFWGGVLIILGGLILVDSLEVIEINLWPIFWPLLLILFGAWILLGYFMRREKEPGEYDSIPLGGIQSAKMVFHHGAGQLKVSSGAESGNLASGTFGGGLRYKIDQGAEDANVSMRIRDSGFPFMIPWLSSWDNYLQWDVRLTQEIPLKLVLKTGASDTQLDLTSLQVTYLRVDTGASATAINLPENVSNTKVIIKAGVASVKIRVPENVAARIHVTGGLMGANVDRNRFQKSGRYYQSPDYDSATNKADIHINEGVGSVTIQ
ncbi:hypothetical protein AMJ86_02910 [bacterium SM23_57]|jgi:hypothetical protein|nr:MAG: hypothetical protein AMJ86_02910 [bacterium SM23_57]